MPTSSDSLKDIEASVIAKKHITDFMNPFFLIALLSSLIFFAEMLVMFVLAQMPDMSVVGRALLDACILSLVLLPVLYFLIFRPFQSYATALKKLEEEREYLNRNLSVMNRELEQVIHAISHDLHQPLTRIKDFLNQMETCFKAIPAASEHDASSGGAQLTVPPLINEVSALLKDTDACFKKMDSALHELLLIDRISHSELQEARIDMKVLVSSISEEIQSRHPGLSFDIRELPSCFGDTALIHRVFSVLMKNAAHSLTGQQRIITVSGHAENGSVVYCVEDNGAGFTQEYFKQIDTAFRPGKSHAITSEGLGFTVVNKILEKHQGKLSIISVNKCCISLPENRMLRSEPRDTRR